MRDEKGVSYRSREDEIRAYISDWFELHRDAPCCMEIGEMFDIRLDDLDLIEQHIRQYDSEGNYFIGGITNEAI